jgi:hypothetical protein
MRGGRVETLQKVLGHATLTMTMKYAHLAPGFIRDEMMKTEKTAPPAASPITHEITQGTGGAVGK